LNATDLSVEHRPQSEGLPKVWCVLRDGELLATSSALDFAVDAAKRLAHGHHCAAWLVVAGAEPILLE
jgi:hypothetical protein